ncbi:FAD-dependent oxidoreductase [Rhodococcus sp. HNM0569]|uniref:FAD-dependent oxidoreductase n=1 Tax=Rhodococcus sp. HNM0569 TaxID=2716340 RepID=UPI00146CD53B|nr:FAD-dependent oxidoreductase [Rhodococcus sp. HNM0569]NLU82706.1 FAD-dependent oxidoreductase [Rhodococcus sp. HNM0569]
MTAPTPVRPRPESEISHWDFEADVVIAGYGIAGVTAAIEAARAGADVLVLERTGGWGGAASLAGGFVYLGGGTATQRACGFDDSPENMKTFMTAALGPGVDEAKIEAYCDGSVEHYDWLVDCGVTFKPSFWGEPAWEPPFDDGLMYSGGENAAPFHEIATPAPRGHVPQMSGKVTGEKGGGFMLMKPLVETAEALGVRAEYDVRIETLVTDTTGRVVGVIAKRYGEEIAVRARRGVVLAMGSFAYNEEMVESFAPRLIGRPGAAIEQHDGRAILMGQALGAAVAHMDATEVAFIADPQHMVRGIMVNGRGQRYIAEDTYPGRIGQATLQQNDNQAFLIIDEAGYEEGAAATSATPFMQQLQPKWVAETVEELEADMGLPAGTLTSTVEVYNRHAAEGRDPLLGKKPEWVKPIGTPIAAIDLRGHTLGFTLGGLKTTVDSEVLHVSGEPIPGLFAAGRCTSGVCAGGYASGTSLGDGSFFGRRAGVSAARAVPVAPASGHESAPATA